MNARTLLLTFGLAVASAGAIVGAGILFGDRSSGTPTTTAEIEAEDPSLLPMPELGPDGLWIADFYRESTGDLARDAAAAAAEGKLLAVMWERRGCEFCLVLHTRTLRIPELHAYLANKFYVVRLNFYGDKPIRDFDGRSMTEQEIAERHRAQGTPTIEFRTGEGKEVLRIPGLVEPLVLLSAFEFADTGAYKQTNINEWLRARNILL